MKPCKICGKRFRSDCFGLCDDCAVELRVSEDFLIDGSKYISRVEDLIHRGLVQRAAFLKWLKEQDSFFQRYNLEDYIEGLRKLELKKHRKVSGRMARKRITLSTGSEEDLRDFQDEFSKRLNADVSPSEAASLILTIGLVRCSSLDEEDLATIREYVGKLPSEGWTSITLDSEGQKALRDFQDELARRLNANVSPSEAASIAFVFGLVISRKLEEEFWAIILEKLQKLRNNDSEAID
jgi:hypothetical protein